jgi:glucokinase
MILAGDVGATKTTLGLFQSDGANLTPVSVRKFLNHNYGSFDAVLDEFLASRDGFTTVCFGIAGPVLEDRVTVTNLHWDIALAALTMRFGIARVCLINDVEATAYGIDVLAADDLLTLNVGIEDKCAPAALIASGTGLGESILLPRGNARVPYPAEAGHADFAPNTPIEAELLQYLWKRYKHVSWDRVLSGPGLRLIYEFLRDNGHGAEQQAVAGKMLTEDAAAAISQAALDGSCELCTKALDIFTAIYGSEAGNLALRALARGGLYVGGGIAPRIISKLSDGVFLHAFCAKGRMTPLLESIPVRVILNDQTGLLGAARYASSQWLS